MVSCDPEDTHPHFCYSAKFLVEVLSKNEERDKVEKLEAYKLIPTLEEYLIIKPDPENREVLLYSKENNWAVPHQQTGGILKIKCLDFSLDLDDLYEYLLEIPEAFKA